MIVGEMKSSIDNLWLRFHTGGVSNPMEVIKQITYLLFIKRLDDLEIAKEKKANSGVFKPYAGVSTAILIFTKTESAGTNQVWSYDMKADGFALNDKRTPTPGNDDTEDIIARWQNLDQEKSRTRLDQSFFVPVDEIRGNNYNLSINKYKETVYEQKQYDVPDVILERLEKLDLDIITARKELEEMLKTGGSHE
jgi:type I restriction enzyme M protein